MGTRKLEFVLVNKSLELLELWEQKWELDTMHCREGMEQTEYIESKDN